MLWPFHVFGFGALPEGFKPFYFLIKCPGPAVRQTLFLSCVHFARHRVSTQQTVCQYMKKEQIAPIFTLSPVSPNLDLTGGNEAVG